MIPSSSVDRNALSLRWARATVMFVLVLGLVVVVGPALGHIGSLFRDPFTAAVETRTVEKFDANGVKTGSEVTTAPAGGSLVERSMAAGGVLLLRIAVVSAAAYLAGALVFRTISGTFPSEIGGVKFVEEAGAGLEKLERSIGIVQGEVGQLASRLTASENDVQSVRRVATTGGRTVSELRHQLDAADEGIERLAEAVAALGDELRDLRQRDQ